MAVHRRTEITVETDRVLIVWERRTTRTWGQECEADTVGPAATGAASRGETTTQNRATSETRFKSDKK